MPKFPTLASGNGLQRSSIERLFLGLSQGLRELETSPEERRLSERMNRVPWRDWVAEMFPGAVAKPFGDHHAAFWDWAWAISPESTPDPFVAAWARGGAKSSTLELAIAGTILRDTRRYWLYIGETQEQAGDHLSPIGGR